jgi:two-component system chemotaxis response regulator CheY
MLKPALLVVNNDAAEIEALDALITPSFQDLLEIRFCSEPETALNVSQRWAAQGRPLAVVMVDERMRSRRGVELVARLREHVAEGISSSFETVMLTGAGICSSAPATNNIAGVDHYLEKPWSNEDVLQTLCVLLRRFLVNNALDRHFAFRKVANYQEMLDHLRLRYAVYRTTATMKQVFLNDTDAGFDLEPHDRGATFLSLFHVGMEENQLIGTMRLSGRAQPGAEELLGRAARDFPETASGLEDTLDVPLPMMKYLVDRDALGQLHGRLKEAGESVVEPGRFALDPGFQTALFGESSAMLGRFMIEGTIAFASFFSSIENAILTCVPAQVRFYRRYGFRAAEGTSTGYQPLLNVEFTCLHGRPEWVPSAERERLSSMGACLRRQNLACRCPSYPECLSKPYETGEFAGVDLFCPLQATARLGESKERTTRPTRGEQFVQLRSLRE